MEEKIVKDIESIIYHPKGRKVVAKEFHIEQIGSALTVDAIEGGGDIFAEILSVGREVEDYEIGQYVCFKKGAARQFSRNTDRYVIDERDILAEVEFWND